MGTHDFKYNKVPIFAQKPWNINTSMSAATTLAPCASKPLLLRCNLCMCQVSLRLKEVQMGVHQSQLVIFKVMGPHLNLFQS